jgi:hypothetical protein
MRKLILFALLLSFSFPARATITEYAIVTLIIDIVDGARSSVELIVTAAPHHFDPSQTVALIELRSGSAHNVIRGKVTGASAPYAAVAVFLYAKSYLARPLPSGVSISSLSTSGPTATAKTDGDAAVLNAIVASVGATDAASAAQVTALVQQAGFAVQGNCVSQPAVPTTAD